MTILGDGREGFLSLRFLAFKGGSAMGPLSIRGMATFLFSVALL